MDERIKKIINEFVTPKTKKLGFKKTRLTFYRRVNDSTQVIRFQMNKVGGEFFVNIILAFDPIYHLSRHTIPEIPHFHSQDPGTNLWYRLEELIPKAPYTWRLDEFTKSQPLFEKCFDELIENLNSINSSETYQKHSWYKHCSLDIRAMFEYMNGSYQTSKDMVLDLCKGCIERKVAFEPGWWIERLGLIKLLPYVDTDTRFKELAIERRKYEEKSRSSIAR